MSSKLLYLSREDVEIVDLYMPTIIEVIEKGFQEMGHNRVEMPPKPGFHPGSGGDNQFRWSYCILATF